jgi:hypothetical protein
VAWKAVGGEPPTILLVVVCVVGAVLALNVVRYVVVFGSAIAGSWTALVGGLAIMGNPTGPQGASAPGIWVVYPIDMFPHQWWVMGLWFLLAVAGGGLFSCPPPRKQAAKSVRSGTRTSNKPFDIVVFT